VNPSFFRGDTLKKGIATHESRSTRTTR
jgi:hypothetical protein